MRLSPPRSEDTGVLIAFFHALSDESRYSRFHGQPAIDERAIAPMVDPDWAERGALVGTYEDEVVALGSYVRLRDVRTAEVAFAVADDFQGRGIGTRLLERLAELAAAAGIEEFLAEVLPSNAPMLGVFADAGFVTSRSLEGGVVEVRLTLAPTAAFQELVDRRDHVAVAASLRPFFAPRTVAVVGASPRHGSIGGGVFRNILRADFAGAAYPVNRSEEPVAGVRAYAAVAQIPDPIDLVVVCLPGQNVLEAADEALRAGVRALCVISAGFAETGEMHGLQPTAPVRCQAKPPSSSEPLAKTNACLRTSGTTRVAGAAGAAADFFAGLEASCLPAAKVTAAVANRKTNVTIAKRGRTERRRAAIRFTSAKTRGKSSPYRVKATTTTLADTRGRPATAKTSPR